MTDLKKPIDVQWLKCELARVNAREFPTEAHLAMEMALRHIEQQEARIKKLEVEATLARAADDIVTYLADSPKSALKVLTEAVIERDNAIAAIAAQSKEQG